MPHITFIHGIANKPPTDKLLDLWHRSLAESDGLDLGTEGVGSSMVYWADVMYPEPLAEGTEESAADESAAEAVSPEAPDLGIEEMDAEEKLWVAELAAKLAVPLVAEEAVAAAPTPVREQLERIPLPWPVKERLMRRLLRDVHHYLFNVSYSPRPGVTFQVQDEIRRRTLEALQAGASAPGPHIVVSHSMGTVIAYDCLKRVAGAPVVDGLMTVGSPLGLDEIQDKLKPEWSRDNGFPHERVRGRWVNVYDHLDPVAGFDPSFADDYRRGGQRTVEDINEQNYGKWRHNISKYLAGGQLRSRLREMLGV
jgi:alpha/beta hydrolase family protein